MNGEGHTIRELLSPSNTWADYTLFGESIPHLLHWDFAYLWILQREQNTRPTGWKPRVEAWRRLLCMLLLNELQLDTKPIPQPLLTYTQARGFSKVTFVRAPSTAFGPRAIGVISPTVLVRPMPEPNRIGVTAEELADVLPAFHQPSVQLVDRRQQLLQALGHAKQALRQSGSQLAITLEKILNTEISVDVNPSANIFPVSELPSPVPLLQSADASSWEEPHLVDLRLMVTQGTTGRRVEYVPKCSHCGKNLTFAEAAPPVNAGEDISISCPDCSAVSLFALEDFGIFKEGQVVYIWQDLQQFSELGDTPIPPSPRVVDDEIRFRWNPGMLSGDPTRTHLRLRFSQAVIAVSPHDIKYDRLLVPGGFENFNGHPIRPEWLFAVEKLPSCEVLQDVVKFRNMRVRGLRFSASLPTYPRAACRIVPDLQVGIYPKPQYTSWRRYRVFWTTETSPDTYAVRVVRHGATNIVVPSEGKGVLEWNESLPYAVSIEESITGQKTSTGATWELTAPTAGANAAQPIYVGVDFGTTTSIIYVDKQEGSQQALTTDDILSTAHLLAGSGHPRASFLPISRSDVDPTFFPSALWFSSQGSYAPIRWSVAAPSPAHRAAHGFKWGLAHEILRRQYLQELLFLALPAAVGKAFPYGGIAPSWKIGFAFPLAFSDPQRAEYVRIFADLRTQVQDYAGGNPAIFSINESFACVRAFGEHQFGEVFLIADLGGGSLDVALFELIRGERGDSALQEFQVGSAKIGGESFVEALARGIAIDQPSREAEYWNIRDAITTQSTAKKYGGSEMQFADLATRFIPIAQELLRVMAAAFVAKEPEKSLQFVLVGNGWRIAEYNTGVQQATHVARRELERSFSLFDIPTLRAYEGNLETDPKHLVAIGALQNAKPGGRNELEEAAHQSKMPGGRDIKVNRGSVLIPWNELVGSAIQTLSPGTRTADLEFERSSGPEPAQGWRERLDHAMPDLQHDPSDAVIRSRMNIVGYGLDKGPLQVMLEKRAAELP
jgi:hypothetical protein